MMFVALMIKPLATLVLILIIPIGTITIVNMNSYVTANTSM